MKRKVWWQGETVEVPLSTVKKVIKILKARKDPSDSLMVSQVEAEEWAVDDAISILKGIISLSEATIEDLFKAYGVEDSFWPSDAGAKAVQALFNGGPLTVDVVRETQDPNLPYVGDKPGLSLVPCQNTPKDDDDV